MRFSRNFNVEGHFLGAPVNLIEPALITFAALFGAVICRRQLARSGRPTKIPFDHPCVSGFPASRIVTLVHFLVKAFASSHALDVTRLKRSPPAPPLNTEI